MTEKQAEVAGHEWQRRFDEVAGKISSALKSMDKGAYWEAIREAQELGPDPRALASQVPAQPPACNANCVHGVDLLQGCVECGRFPILAPVPAQGTPPAPPAKLMMLAGMECGCETNGELIRPCDRHLDWWRKVLQPTAPVPAQRTPPAPAKPLTIPLGLHDDTAQLVMDFASAMARKLFDAQEKYGYSVEWKKDDWVEACREHLLDHVRKGDPRDVANYCAFLWYHKQSTCPAPASPQIAETLRMPTMDEAHRFVDSNPVTTAEMLAETLDRQRTEHNEIIEKLIGSQVRESDKLRAALAESDKATSRAVKLAIEEHEAACCPEDYGCKEYIAFLNSHNKHLQACIDQSTRALGEVKGNWMRARLDEARHHKSQCTNTLCELQCLCDQRIAELELAAQPTPAPKEKAGE